MNNILAAELSIENVTMICNIVIIALGVICLLSALMGIRKGLGKSLLKLVVWMILLGVVYGFNMRFTEIYFNIDLTSIIEMTGMSRTIDFQGTQINLCQHIGKIIEDILVSYDLASGTAAVTALAMSILSFVVLIVHLILCLFISPILTFILYFLIVKPLFGRTMEKHKLRIGGFFVNGVKSALVGVCFMMPLFTTTEVLLSNYKDGLAENYEYDKNKSNDAWNMLYPAMTGYNNSILHQLFSFVTGSGTNNGFMTATVEGTDVQVNFTDVAGRVFSVACATLSVAEDFSQAALITAIATDHTLGVLTDKVLSSAFLMSSVLPVVANFGLKMIVENDGAIISKEDADKISEEIGNIDFGADLSSYVTLIRVLNENNLISDAYTQADSFDFAFSRDNQTTLNKALTAFRTAQESIKEDPNKKTILEVVLPPVLASLVRSNTTEDIPLSSFLPNDADGYKGFDLVSLIQSVSDVVFNLNDIYKATLKTENDISISTFDVVQKNAMRVLFNHDSVFDGAPDSRDDTATIKTIDLFVGTEKDQGLLDISLLLNGFPAIVDFALDSLSSGITLTDDLKNNINSLLDDFGSDKTKWGAELGALLRFVGTIFDNPDIPLLMIDANGELIPFDPSTIDYSNQAFLNALKDLCLMIDDSKIATQLLPEIVVSNLDLESNEIFQTYNVDIKKLNFTKFDNSSLGKEMAKLVDAFSAIADFKLEDGEDILTTDSITPEELKVALTTFASCQIINPKLSLIAKEDNLLRTLILTIFNDKQLTDMGFYLSEENYDAHLTNNTLDIEFEKIADLFSVIRSSEGIKKAMSGGTVGLTDFTGKEVADLIGAIADSDFLRPCLATVLKSQIGPVLDSAGMNQEYMNFELMENASAALWKQQGVKLGDVLDKAKDVLGDSDFASIDWLELIQDDAKRGEIEVMLQSLASLAFLDEAYYEATDTAKTYPLDRFGMILLSMMEGAMPQYIDKTDTTVYEAIRKDFSFPYYSVYDKVIGEESPTETINREEKWNQEISSLMDILKVVATSFVGTDEEGNTVINFGTITSENVSEITTLLVGNQVSPEVYEAGFNDLTTMRTILANIIDISFGDGSMLKNDTFDFSEYYLYVSVFENELNLNSDTFTDYWNSSTIDKTLSYRNAEIALRKNELNNILSVVDDILNLGEFNSENLFNWANSLETILESVHDSLIMHSPTKARVESKLTAFEGIIKLVLDQSIGTTLYQDIPDADALKNNIIAITSGTYGTTWFGQNGEITNISNALKTISNLKTAEGEDTTLKKFIMGETGVSLELSGLNEDENHEEIALVLKALAKSKLINPDANFGSYYVNNSLLGKLFDDQVGGQFTSIGMGQHSFAKTSLFNNDWDSEASALSNLINTLKEVTLKPDGSYEDIGSISWTDSTVLGKMLNSLYDIPSINAVYDNGSNASSFADLVNYAISSSFNSDGTMFTTEDEEQITKDIYTIGLEGTSWKSGDGTSDGEIDKFVNLISSAGEEGYGLFVDGQFVPANLTNKYNGNTEPGIALLQDMNSVYFLRTVLSSMLSSQFDQSGFEVATLQIGKVYNDLFAKQFNYLSADKETTITSRADEQEARRVEIEHLIAIIENIEVVNQTLSEGTSISSFNDEGVINALFDMLQEMQESSFFHKGRYGIEATSTTFFEDSMILLMDNAKVSELIYSAERDTAYANAADKTTAYVKNVSLGVVQSNATSVVAWESELLSLKNIFLNISKSETLGNLTDLSGVTSLSDNDIKALLQSFNASYLTHDIVGNSVKEVLQSVDFESFRVDTNESATAPDYYLDSMNTVYFSDDVTVWDKEIENIMAMKGLIGTKLISDFSSAGVQISALLESISNSNIIKPMFNDFLFSIIDKAGLSDYVSNIADSNNPNYVSYIHDYTGDANASKKQKRDTITYLNEQVISKRSLAQDENTWAVEGKYLENLLNSLKSSLELDIENVDANTSRIVTDLFGSVYEYTGVDYNYAVNADNAQSILDMVDTSKYQRGYIASELMLNFCHDKMGLVGVTCFGEIRYDYSYIYFNNYEKEAISSILSLYFNLSSLSSAMGLLRVDFSTYARIMGPGELETGNPLRDENKIILKDGLNANATKELLDNGYLEKAVQAYVSLNNVFVVGNYSVEYAAENVWPAKLASAISPF